MRIVLLAYIFLTFLAPENEGLRDDCPQCVDNSANRFLASATSNSNQFQFQRTSNRALPQYRPIIAAYHPRVSNRQQFFSRNADHLLDEIEAPVQPHQAQPHSYVRVPIRSKVATMTPLTSTVATTPATTSSTTTTTTTTTSTTTTTTTTARPEPELESYEDVPVSSTSRPNYRPRPVSIRTPFAGRNPKQNVFNRTPSTPRTTTPNSWNEVTKVSPVINAIAEDDNSDNKAEFEPKRREERRGRQRKRFRSTTTSTTTLEPPLEDDDDYYDYDQEYDDYDYPATTTTTTTTQRPRGRERGRGGRGRHRGRPYRRGGRRRPRPTEPTTTTTTTTLSPNYKARPDGRIIDYNADPNFPYELKGADLTDYPFYISIPENDFKCKGRHDGYYANIELSCQVYHHCASGHQRYDFLCPNYTLFDQTTFTCRFINTVDCATSENHYVRNNELYVTTPNPNSDYVRPPLRQFYPNDGDKSRTSEATGKLQSSASEMQQAAVEFALRNGAKLETTNQGDTKERIRTL